LKVWEKAIGGIEEYRKDILTALYRRNFDLIEELALPRDKKQELWSLFNFRGEETDYEKLSRIVARLDSERVFVDYGTLRPLPYYEDLVFEVYSPRYGQPVGAGGEYTLNGNKACGFAFDMDALVEIFDGEVDGNRRPVNLEDDHPYRSARKLVQEGTAIEVRT
ncbi:MAG: ATP phosphoribosyltransferase regulatory subunit, partial [Candidatus Acetothermia bacterium]